MRIITTIVLILISINLTLAQSTAKGYGFATKKELDRDKIIQEILKKEKSLSKQKTELHSIIAKSTFGFRPSKGSAKAKYENLIVDSRNILRKIDEGNFIPKCKEINKMRKSIDSYSESWNKCPGINDLIKKANENISWAKSQLEEKTEEETKEKSSKYAHKQKMKSLDAELQKELSKTPKQKKRDTRSVKDFLSTVKKTKSNNNDFLANNNTNKANNDFLSGIASTKKEKSKKDFEIKSKDGKQGVISSNGKILIPFKEWRILEFYKGVAKVMLKIDNIPFKDDYGYNVYTISFEVFKQGYVDFSGKFLEEPIIVVEGGCDFSPRSGLEVKYKGETWDEAKRRYEKYDKNQSIELAKCKNYAYTLENRIKSRYK